MRVALAACVLSLGVMWAGAAHACGGGLVVAVPGGAGADAQRIFFSVRGGTTDVISEIGVPATGSDYGVLLPVPAEPTLDGQPVSSAELDALDRATAPRIFLSSSSGDDGGIGCACGGASKNAGGGGGGGAVDVKAPVAIGPVTATALTGATGDAVNAWLSQNGFAIPADQQPLVDAYAGPGRWFIAIRRNDSAATGVASSVGVHFTLPVADRTLPLRFARMGAAPEVAFTVFVAAPGVAAPSDPFAALTIQDLDAATLRTSGYSLAVSNAVAARAGRAFVVDGAYPAASLAGRIGPGVEGLLAPDAQVTRLTTILSASALTEDAALDGTFTGTPPTVRTVHAEPAAPGGPRGGGGAGTALAAAAALLLRRRRLRASR
jgi:hypothetical protein